MAWLAAGSKSVIDLETNEPAFRVFADQLTTEDGDRVRLDSHFDFLAANTHFGYLTSEGVVYAVDLASGAVTDSLAAGDAPRIGAFSSADTGRLAALSRDRVSIWEG